MKKETLMKKYESGELGPEDQELLESYIEQGIINIEELEDLHEIREAANPQPGQIPSEQMKARFHALLASARHKYNRSNVWDRLWNILSIDLPVGQFYRLVYTFGLLLIGLVGGWLLSPADKYQDQITEINSEVRQMKEMMVLSMLEKPSATERLKAVNISSELPSGYGKVVDALFNTLNNDENVNVRLAALETLADYAEDPIVRENLIKSISNQSSPLVQISMAEIMVALQEKRSVEELQKLIDKESTDPEIREQLQESISQLI